MARKLHFITDAAGINLADAATSLPFPPVEYGLIGASWRDAAVGVPAEFDLLLWGTAACDVTEARLYGGALHDVTLVDDDVDTVDFANDELDLNAHVYETGDGPVTIASDTTLPTGLTAGLDYYVIKIGANTIQLALTFEEAMAGTAVSIDDAGAGTHTISDDPGNTKRLYWHDFGYLGEAKDGAITITATKARAEQVDHNPLIRAYAVVATLSANNLHATLYPRLSR